MKQVINSHNDFFSYSFSLDCVIFGYKEGKLYVLLIERNIEPFKGYWAVPGDLIKKDENLKEAAKRILFDLTKLKHVKLHQARTFGKPDRHPLGRVITCAYMALVNIGEMKAEPSSWASNVKWEPVHEVSGLAFDHDKILKSSTKLLKNKLENEPVCFNLLPKNFIISELQDLYEYVFCKTLDKANFRKKIKKLPLTLLDQKQKNVKHRPSKLYTFDEEEYFRKIKEEDYRFKM